MDIEATGGQGLIFQARGTSFPGRAIRNLAFKICKTVFTDRSVSQPLGRGLKKFGNHCSRASKTEEYIIYSGMNILYISRFCLILNFF
jgi:hypothetical protein